MNDKDPKHQGEGEGLGGELSDETRRRLKPYGLAGEEAAVGDIVVPAKHKLRLSTNRGKIRERGFVHLRPRSIDDVKRWIGVSNEVATKMPCRHVCPSSVAMVAAPSDVRKLNQGALRDLHRMGEAYVHGDATHLTPYREVLNHLMHDAVIIGVFVRGDITVYSGAVLEVGADVRLIWARHIRVWSGGTIVLEGDTKIDCTSIEANISRPMREVDASIAIGRLSPLGG